MVRKLLLSWTNGPPDLIFLDVMMPVMNGWGFLSAYWERPGPHPAVIVFTTQQHFREHAEAQGAVAFLPKPFDIEALLGLAAAHLAGPASNQQPAV
jgi:CheY-like chemotaxis protein